MRVPGDRAGVWGAGVMRRQGDVGFQEDGA